MPSYEYRVKEGHKTCDYCKGNDEGIFEVKQKITDDPLKKCPECESPLEKLISKSSFNIKGYSYKNSYSKPSEKRK